MTNLVTGSVLLTHDVGLHARPSVKLTKLAKRFEASIRLAVSQDGPWLDAKSISRVMAAKVPKDSTLFFEAEGEDAESAISALVTLVERDFENETDPTA